MHLFCSCWGDAIIWTDWTGARLKGKTSVYRNFLDIEGGDWGLSPLSQVIWLSHSHHGPNHTPRERELLFSILWLSFVTFSPPRVRLKRQCGFRIVTFVTLMNNYRTRVRSLAMLVTHSLTHLLRLLLLLMLMTRIVLATVCCRFGSCSLIIKLSFCSDFKHFGQDFEVEVQAGFWSWSWSVFCCWCLVEATKLNIGQYSEGQ